MKYSFAVLGLPDNASGQGADVDRLTFLRPHPDVRALRGLAGLLHLCARPLQQKSQSEGRLQGRDQPLLHLRGGFGGGHRGCAARRCWRCRSGRAPSIISPPRRIRPSSSSSASSSNGTPGIRAPTAYSSRPAKNSSPATTRLASTRPTPISRTISSSPTDFIVPVDKPVIAYISSLDVIHSFACRPCAPCRTPFPAWSIPAAFHARENRHLYDQLRPALRRRPLRHEGHRQSCFRPRNTKNGSPANPKAARERERATNKSFGAHAVEWAVLGRDSAVSKIQWPSGPAIVIAFIMRLAVHGSRAAAGLHRHGRFLVDQPKRPDRHPRQSPRPGLDRRRHFHPLPRRMSRSCPLT